MPDFSLINFLWLILFLTRMEAKKLLGRHDKYEVQMGA